MISLFRLPFNSLKRLSRLRSLFFLAFFCLRFHVNHKSLLLFLLSWFYSTGREREWVSVSGSTQTEMTSSCSPPTLVERKQRQGSTPYLILGSMHRVCWLAAYLAYSFFFSRLSFLPLAFPFLDVLFSPLFVTKEPINTSNTWDNMGSTIFKLNCAAGGRGIRSERARACVCTRVTGKWITTGGSWCRLLVLVVVSVF